jgi:hypothetical protein
MVSIAEWCVNAQHVIPGRAKHEPGISRFFDVQLHIGVRIFDAPRNDG